MLRGSLERAQVYRRDFAVATGLCLVPNLLSLAQGRKTSALDSGDVHENVVAALIRLDEAVALLAVEPLHSAVCHPCLQSKKVIPSDGCTEDIKSRDGDVSVDALKRRRIVNQGVFDRPYMDRAQMKGKAERGRSGHVCRTLPTLQNDRASAGFAGPEYAQSDGASICSSDGNNP